mmetsp:Transcript_89339/g.255083  ORF Transcript_89339/g.255083 Transcript_89339/m.255083 type:complete len:209 (-) Transcript_89339:493-1119(-)
MDDKPSNSWADAEGAMDPHTTVSSHSSGSADPVREDDARPAWHDAAADEEVDGDVWEDPNPGEGTQANDDRWWVNDGRWWTKFSHWDDDWLDLHSGPRFHDDWHGHNGDDDDKIIDVEFGDDDYAGVVGDDNFDIVINPRRRRIDEDANGAPTRRPTMHPTTSTHPFFPMHGESHRTGTVRQRFPSLPQSLLCPRPPLCFLQFRHFGH